MVKKRDLPGKQNKRSMDCTTTWMATKSRGRDMDLPTFLVGDLSIRQSQLLLSRSRILMVSSLSEGLWIYWATLIGRLPLESLMNLGASR